MAFSDYEYSLEDGEPIELYRFVINGSEYYLTSSQESYTDVLGNVHAVSPIKRGELKDTNNEASSKVNFEFPYEDSFSEFIQTNSSTSTITIDVFKVHLNDPDNEKVLLWSGRVVDKRRSNYKYILSAEPYMNYLNRSGMRGHYQRICRYTLYKEGCYADPTPNKQEFTVTGQLGNVLNVDGSPTPLMYVGGFVRIKGTKFSRMVLTHSGSSLSLSSGFTNISVGDVVEIFAGCNHSLSDCSNKFNNTHNFGGFPWIPGKNPMGGSSII